MENEKRKAHRLKCRYCINDKCIKHTPPTPCTESVICQRMTYYDRKNAPVSKEYHGDIGAWLKAYDPLLVCADLPTPKPIY